MTSDQVALERAVNVAKTILQESGETVTEEDLLGAAAGAMAMASTMSGDVVENELMAILRAEISVWMGEQTILNADDADHEFWLSKRKQDQANWPFWENYKSLASQKMSPNVIRRLDRISDDILDRIGDPENSDPWDRRGMVVGNVQSGKTANYLGLITKAADAGYKFIVILAGSHNSLRSQTQQRVDEGLLGFDSSRASDGQKKRIGVGAMGRKNPNAISLTSSENNGDFNKHAAGQFTGRVDPDGPPFVLVVKKHKSVLDNLHDWVTATTGEDVGKADRKVSSVPLLLVDDEADYASVNTKKIDAFEKPDEETDPTAINKAIRRLLNAFDRSSYVGYTATPYANIFIPDAFEQSKHGDDLFPRSFVIRIKPPSNYVGPKEVFGLPYSVAGDTESREGIPIVRTVTDQDGWLPKKHKKDDAPGPIPVSMRLALKSFVLACAVRSWRGETESHNSMLVHVTRFVDVQGRVAEQIRDELESLRSGLRYDDRETLKESRRIWDEDFLETSVSAAITERAGNKTRPALPSWTELSPTLASCADRIEVSEINGSSKDALQYTRHPRGLWTIAVGGDKLSRGLTLEGLSVSYYLRASNMYDTLMQMGRWFGYRDTYLDVSRLFTTKDLQNDYKMIALANEELNEKFDEMAELDASPTKFALYVRQSDSRLAITSATKMRDTTKVKLTFSDDYVETLMFDRSAETHERNLLTLTDFLQKQSDRGRQLAGDHNPIGWQEVPGKEVASFFAKFVTADESRKARGALLAEWVSSRLKLGELEDWSVYLVNSTDKTANRIQIPGLGEIGLVRRADQREGRPGPYTLKRLGIQQHETLDLTDAQIAEAEEMRRMQQERLLIEADALNDKTEKGAAKNLALGPFARKVRSPRNGLLVIYLIDPESAKIDGLSAIPGFMIAFPPSKDDAENIIRMPSRYLSKGLVDDI